MKYYLVLGSIVLCLLAAAVPIPGTDVWYSQFIAVMMFGFLMVAIEISQMSIAIAVLFVYMLISMVFVDHQDNMAMICLVQTGMCLFIAKVISCLETSRRRNIWFVIGGLLAFQCVWGALQHFNLDPIFRYAYDTKVCDTVGFSGSHNQYGLFLAAAAPVAFMFPLSLPLVFASLVLAKTFSAVLGFLAATAFFYAPYCNKILMFFIGIALIVAFFFLAHKDLYGKFHERFGLWKLSTRQVLQGKAVMQLNKSTQRIVTCNPILGFGFQRFFNISPSTQASIIMPNREHRYEHAHNDYVELFFDLGFVGALMLFGIFLEIGHAYIFAEKTLWLRLATASLIAYAVCALSIYAVHTAYNAMFLCVFLGLFYGEVLDGKKRRQQGTAQVV